MKIWGRILGLGLFVILGLKQSDLWAEESYATHAETDAMQEPGQQGSFDIYYYNILYGPSLRRPNAYQPDLAGRPDYTNPVTLRNFLSLTYTFANQMSVFGTGYWLWQPVVQPAIQLQDPFVGVSHGALVDTDQWTWYGDLRFHLPATANSRSVQMIAGVQTFHSVNYTFPASRLTLGSFFSARKNIYRVNTYGSDWEVYFGPNLWYQLGSRIALTVLYEIQASHDLTDPQMLLYADGSDVQPGVNWSITPALTINPYVNIPTTRGLGLRATSIGMFMSWTLI